MTTLRDVAAAPSDAPNAPRARVADLTVTFERRGVAVNALRGITLDINPGEILAVVGESGSGKSVMGLAL
ncbi:MAG: peptide/nickel transport system ATP-binding protein ddpF, partial [Mycobacterium sp.]|nr:peptide/nickel transport system ATP-binding protein ddpF [Mycobacterium sp.]